jgi:hypothetical protein
MGRQHNQFSGSAGLPQRTPAEQDAVTALVEGEVEAKMRAKEPFTALDVSNALKAQNFPVRHREVAAVVRDIYDSGAMAHYEYERRMIDVVTDGGKTRAQAWLYLHDDHKDRDYATTARAQDALPPVDESAARSLDDVTPAGNPLSPLVAAGKAAAPVARRQGGTRGRTRRDGALAIPRRLIAQAGFQVGDQLTLVFDAAASKLVLTADADVTATTVTETVRVWADLRVRVAKTKVRRCAAPLAANFAVGANTPKFALDGDGTLGIEP